ncbi:unnamed protein product [Cylicostephanus goldi]|uniref:EB domain-containing protein n=1 Tax=Cylicostephanus goldi TaxID=71465 RepID=A0A3P6TNI3_CYLGO|nr:unnamed protein product [Cylicostephanus goldi]
MYTSSLSITFFLTLNFFVKSRYRQVEHNRSERDGFQRFSNHSTTAAAAQPIHSLFWQTLRCIEWPYRINYWCQLGHYSLHVMARIFSKLEGRLDSCVPFHCFPDLHFAVRMDKNIELCNFPACPAQTTCPNGGRYLNVGCRSSFQCTPYYSGSSTCINGCCCTVPTVFTTPPSTERFGNSSICEKSLLFDFAIQGFCPSGQLSEVRCSGRYQCQAGQTCMTGLCCTTIGNEWNVACGGLAALGSCSSGMCTTGVCTASNYCCECPVGRSSGRCNNVSAKLDLKHACEQDRITLQFVRKKSVLK